MHTELSVIQLKLGFDFEVNVKNSLLKNLLD